MVSQWSVVGLALPPDAVRSGVVSFGSAWGDQSTPPRGAERGQVGSAAWRCVLGRGMRRIIFQKWY